MTAKFNMIQVLGSNGKSYNQLIKIFENNTGIDHNVKDQIDYLIDYYTKNGLIHRERNQFVLTVKGNNILKRINNRKLE